MKKKFPLIILSITVLVKIQSQPYFPDNDEIYRQDIVPRIDITINEDTLQWLYNNVDSRQEFKAHFRYTANGVSDSIEQVGFRLRGQTSRNSEKKSFKISFNTYTPGGKFHGIEKMNLNGEHNDPSVIRSRIVWELFKDMQVPAPRCNHVNVYINGRFYGLYINVEHIDEEFVDSRFGNNMGNLYKCLFPADLVYNGPNKEDYSSNRYLLQTNQEEDNYTDIINLMQVIDNSASDQLPANLEPIFNVNSFLRFLAVEEFTGHWDSYSFFKNNYYLFNNLYTGKIEFIPYDVDNTFGIDWFGIDWANRDIYHWWNDSDPRPLTSKIFGYQVYKDRFSFFMNELITKYANADSLFPKIDAIKAKIDASAAADPYRSLDYGWTFSDFNKSYTESLGAHVKYGLKPYITARISSIQSQIDLNPIDPIIENVSHNFPQINDSIKIQLNITDDQPNPTGKIFYKINDGAFTAISLKKNSDNRYTATLPPITEPCVFKYYIEATDAGSNTTREPSVGEYSITIQVSTTPLMISEFMSNNQNSIVDNYGQQEDWIEIKNKGSIPVNLKGKYLTDDLAKPDKFKLPDVTIEPGGYYLVWADDDRNQGDNHANFKLSSGGESIALIDSFETNYASISAHNYIAQESDKSEGIDSSGNWNPQSFITPMGENNSEDVAFITFRYNMNRQIAIGHFDPFNEYIDVAGTFNNWSGDEKVYDANDDGIYQYTAFGFTAGENIEYKARINSDWGNAEFPELAGAGNRHYAVVSGHNIVENWYNDELLDIKESSSDAMISIYPNPASSGQFQISASFAIESITIYSVMGAIISQERNIRTNYIEINNYLQKGIYLIKLTGDGKEFVTKLIVY